MRSINKKSTVLNNKRGPFTRKALLVEDNKILEFVYRQYLEKLRYCVESVDNGEAALRRTAEEDYDLMLLDLGLPGVSGEFVLCSIRLREFSTSKHLPIIINTAHGDETKLQKCREQGADAAFQKPFSFDYLQQVLQEIIPNHLVSQ